MANWDPDAPVLTRPPQKWLDHFKLRSVGFASVREYIEKRFSLCIFCVECPKVVEWKPAELAERFNGKLGVRVADVATRLTCSCGSHRIAVGPRYNKLTDAERQALAAQQAA